MYYFIVNEASGRGRAKRKWLDLKRSMTAANIPFAVWTTHYAGEATELARLASTMPGETVPLVVVGGDGTINEVLNGITDFDRVALGVVPYGSGNDFARGLGLATDPYEALQNIFSSRGEKRIDLGQVKLDRLAPRRFGISSGVGMDAQVCQRVEGSKAKKWLNQLGMGQLAYGAMTVPVVSGMRVVGGSVTLTTPEGEACLSFEKLLFLAAMNFSKEGGGVPVAPNATAEDGLLSVCMATELSLAGALSKLPRLAIGRHEHSKGVEARDVTAVALTLDAPLAVHTDGEVIGIGRQVRYEVLPQVLRILC